MSPSPIVMSDFTSPRVGPSTGGPARRPRAPTTTLECVRRARASGADRAAVGRLPIRHETRFDADVAGSPGRSRLAMPVPDDGCGSGTERVPASVNRRRPVEGDDEWRGASQHARMHVALRAAEAGRVRRRGLRRGSRRIRAAPDRPALKHFAVETERSARDVTVDAAGQFGARDDRRNRRLIAAARRLRGAMEEAVVSGNRQRDRSGGAVGRCCPRTLTCRRGRPWQSAGGEHGPTSGANRSRHGGPRQRFSRCR